MRFGIKKQQLNNASAYKKIIHSFQEEYKKNIKESMHKMHSCNDI